MLLNREPFQVLEDLNEYLLDGKKLLDTLRTYAAQAHNVATSSSVENPVKLGEPIAEFTSDDYEHFDLLIQKWHKEVDLFLGQVFKHAVPKVSFALTEVFEDNPDSSRYRVDDYSLLERRLVKKLSLLADYYNTLFRVYNLPIDFIFERGELWISGVLMELKPNSTNFRLIACFFDESELGVPIEAKDIFRAVYGLMHYDNLPKDWKKKLSNVVSNFNRDAKEVFNFQLIGACQKGASYVFKIPVGIRNRF